MVRCGAEVPFGGEFELRAQIWAAYLSIPCAEDANMGMAGVTWKQKTKLNGVSDVGSDVGTMRECKSYEDCGYTSN